jgi:hypothetical protein
MPALNNQNHVAYRANLTGTGVDATNSQVVYLEATPIARAGDQAPGLPAGVLLQNGTFTAPRLAGTDEVVFRTGLTGAGVTTTNNEAIYRNSTLVARSGAASPIGPNYGNFGLPQTNATGQVAFQSGLNAPIGQNEAIWRDAALIARSGNGVPGFAGVSFARFSDHVLLNDRGTVAFEADLNGVPGMTLPQALFLGDGIEIVQVARRGDPLEGSTINQFLVVDQQLRAGGLNNHGQVVYNARLADGRDGIFLFTPDLRWRANGSGNWDDPANWTLSLLPGLPHDVRIDPATNATVFGPAADARIRSLTIGGGAGTALLLLDAQVSTTVPGGVTVASNGIMAGNGTVVGNVGTQGGTIAPGQSPGLLTIDGDLTLDSDATLEMELAGAARGTQYDAVDATGALTLAGALSVSFLDGFAPATGSQFDLALADTIAGSFQQVLLPTLGAGSSWSLAIVTDAFGAQDALRLSVVPEPPIAVLVGSAGLALVGGVRRRRRG